MAVTEFTQNMMAKFPSWMKMAKDPDSIGAQFLDVFGLTFHAFEKEMNEIEENFYIETAHTDMIDILYKVPLASPVILDMEDIESVLIEQNNGNTQLVFDSINLRDFYQREVALPKFFADRASGYLYLRVDFTLIEDTEQPFKSIIVNGAPQYEVELHHVWNAFDEFGLLLGLQRLPYERNTAYKERLLDVFRKPASVTREGVKNGLARELGLETEEIQIVPFSTNTFNSELIKPDGTPTEKMTHYAKQINDNLKFTWDSMNFGEAYWFSVEQDNLGIDFLPHIWDVDASLFGTKAFQSGIGHGDDLKVTAPKEESSAKEFKAFVSLMGYYEQSEDIFPEIAFQYKIYAKGKVLEQDYEEQSFRYTVQAAETFKQEYQVIGKQEFDYTIRTDFDNTNAFEAGNDRDKIKFGKSNDFLHTQTDTIFRLGMQLSTTTDTDSNRIPDLGVVWEDTAGAEHTFSFKTEDDFLIDKTNVSGNPLTNVVYTDVSYDDIDGIGLGYGAFKKDIDTTIEWQQGSYTTETTLVRNGGVTLNLDRMARIMN